jgi:uncharacterized protein with HEPN domain
LVAPPAYFEGSQAAVKKDPRVYLAHILECAQKIQRYTKGGEKEFNNDTMLQDAVIRNFEIIGEAAKRVPEAYRRAHSQIPWSLMAGFRDVLIHAYEGIDLKRVWWIVRHDLPVVKGAVENLLPPLEELEKELAELETDKEKSKK